MGGTLTRTQLLVLLLVSLSNWSNQMQRYLPVFLSSVPTPHCSSDCEDARFVPLCHSCGGGGGHDDDDDVSSCRVCQDCREDEDGKYYNMKDGACVTTVQYGILVGFAFSAMFCLASVLAGGLTNRLQPHVMGAVSLVVWSGAVIGLGFAESFAVALISRVVLGAAQAFNAPCCYQIIGSFFPVSKRSMANSVYSMGTYLGVSTGSLCIVIALQVGWRAVCFACGALGILLAVPFFWCTAVPRGGYAALDSKRDPDAEDESAINSTATTPSHTEVQRDNAAVPVAPLHKPLLGDDDGDENEQFDSKDPDRGGRNDDRDSCLQPRETEGFRPSRESNTTEQEVVLFKDGRPLAASEGTLRHGRGARNGDNGVDARQADAGGGAGEDTGAERDTDDNEERIGTLVGVRIVLTNVNVALLLLASCFRFQAGFAIATYSAVYFSREFSSQIDAFSLFNAVVVTVAGVSSAYLGGVLSDRWARPTDYKPCGRPGAPAFVSGMGGLLAIVPAFVTLFSPNIVVALGALFVEYLLAECWLGPVVTAIQSLVPEPVHGIAVGCYMFTILLGNLAPTVIGVLDPGTPDLREVLFAVIALAYIVSGTIFLIACRRMNRDAKAAYAMKEDDLARYHADQRLSLSAAAAASGANSPSASGGNRLSESQRGSTVSADAVPYSRTGDAPEFNGLFSSSTPAGGAPPRSPTLAFPSPTAKPAAVGSTAAATTAVAGAEATARGTRGGAVAGQRGMSRASVARQAGGGPPQVPASALNRQRLNSQRLSHMGMFMGAGALGGTWGVKQLESTGLDSIASQDSFRNSVRSVSVGHAHSTASGEGDPTFPAIEGDDGTVTTPGARNVSVAW